MKNPTRAAATLTVAMVLLLATTIFAQQLSTQNEKTSADAKTVKAVCDMVQKHHISHHKIDDEISKKLLKTFLEQLDPQKMYFMKADIEEFKKYETELDDLLKVGNADFAFMVYDRYTKRLDERLPLAQKLIDADHDFTAEEDIVIEADELDWAASDDEISERWRKRIKSDLLLLKLDKKTTEEAREKLHKRYRYLHSMERQYEDGEKLEVYLSSLTHCFDPHSAYMSPETLEDFRISMELSLEGIGASLRSEDGYTIVHEIVPDGAAAKDGRIKVNDTILAVGQAEGEMLDVVDMKLKHVVRHIRGNKGTKVRLQVKKADTGAIETYELVRQAIALNEQAVRGEIINTGDRLAGTNMRIGVIDIPSFYRDFRGAQQGIDNFRSTSRDVEAVLSKFRDDGNVDGIVVDLRTNGGGALNEAIEVSGLFIDQGPVVQVKEQNGKIKSHDDEVAGVAYSGPLVVLCNRLSASASEIFAGVIRDYDRGIIVGDSTTHGKGTVQNVMPVTPRVFAFFANREDRGALKLTINQFYRVNGDSTQNRGVQSDVVLPSLIDHMDLGESFMDNALAFDRVEPAKYTANDYITPEILSALRTSSQTRVAANTEFQKDLKDIDRFLARKNRKAVSLNEEARRKERAEDQRESEKKKEEGKESDPVSELEEESGGGPVFKQTYYTDEVLAIAIDYANQLKGLITAKK